MSKMDDKDLEKVAGSGPGGNLQDLFDETNYGASGATREPEAVDETELPADGSNQGVERD